jgi:type II secretory pathway pseudopilin PulG
MRMMKSSRHQVAPVLRKRCVIALTLVELLVVIAVFAILAGMMHSVFFSVSRKGLQAVDLSNAKQIGLGLRLYATDHKGSFPPATISANSAYRYLVPNYIPSQKIFFLANSGWCAGSHREDASTSGTLMAGQNNFTYVSGLKDSDDTNFPLLADGFNDGTPGVYNSVKGTKGGVWKGTKAIVVRVDDTAWIETVGSDYRVHANGANTDDANVDIFTTGATWMPSATVLNPE